MASQDIQELVTVLLRESGFEHFGFAALSPAVSFMHYQSWIEDGRHGDMEYLERHLPIKRYPQEWLKARGFKKANCAIVVAAPYPSRNIERLKAVKIAGYARGDDYHNWLRERLAQVAAELKLRFNDDEFLVATDSQPILERDLAYRAGLGWVGKNTCLIDQRRGSFFLLGEIVTSLSLPIATVPHADRCGTCRRCIDACPTQAIVEPRILDARKCISYWTIESKILPPPELRKKIGDHFFGCDICQDVCPWNQKVVVPSVNGANHAKTEDDRRKSVIHELRWILESSSTSLERALEATPLSRARGFGLKRNAIIVCANLKLIELRELVARYSTDSRLGELASWALYEIDC